MTTQMVVKGLAVAVLRKRVKNLHLRVRPPHGEVQLTIPLFVREDAIHSLISDRFDWIKRQQEKFKNYMPPTPQNMVSGEQHYFRGQAYVLNVVPARGVGRVEWYPADNGADPVLLMSARENSTALYRKKILQNWYREQLLLIIPPLLEKWQLQMGVEVVGWGVKKMKSRWGSCHTRDKYIWLSLDLIKAAPICLEYVLVHELVHLLEASHNQRFKMLMDRFMPDWRLHKAELNKIIPEGRYSQ